MGDDLDYGRDDGLFDAAQWDVDTDAFLETSADTEAEWLEQELERVEQQLEKREELHENIVRRLEWKVDHYTDRLESLYTHGKGKDGTRDRVKDRIHQCYEELREEQRQHWRDRQQLEEERRAILRELDRATDGYLSEI